MNSSSKTYEAFNQVHPIGMLMVNGPNEFPFSFADRFFLFQLGEQKGERAGIRAKKIGGVDRNRTGLSDFADRCLTSWLPRLVMFYTIIRVSGKANRKT